MKIKKIVLCLLFVCSFSNADVPIPSWVSSAPTNTSNGTNKETNYNASNYETPKNQDNQDIADLPPLSVPFTLSEKMVSPLTAEEIIKLRQLYDQTRAAKYDQSIKTLPRITTQTVDLSPGAAIPIVRTMPLETSTIVFIDSAGMPWNLAAKPRISNPNAFDVEWIENSATVVISVKNQFQQGNITAFLEGLTSPVVVKITTSDLLSKSKKERIIDYRLDLRLPYRGPNSKGEILSDSKIALYDDTLQLILDGVPPKDSKKITFTGSQDPVIKNVKIWQVQDKLYIRTNVNIQNAYDKTLSSSDGTKVFELPVTPYLTLSSADKKIILKLNI